MLLRAFVMLVFAATLGAQNYSLAIVEKKAGALRLRLRRSAGTCSG
jgi:hypothetical protein